MKKLILHTSQLVLISIVLILTIKEIDFENLKLKSIDSVRLFVYTTLMITSFIGIVKYFKEKSSQASNN